jgi:hypothetical protein
MSDDASVRATTKGRPRMEVLLVSDQDFHDGIWWLVWGNANAIPVPLNWLVTCTASRPLGDHLFVYLCLGRGAVKPFIPICSFTSLPRTRPKELCTGQKCWPSLFTVDALFRALCTRLHCRLEINVKCHFHFHPNLVERGNESTAALPHRAFIFTFDDCL